jgi:ubiquinol-cytochrome c reductase cytochrome b subunit
LLIILPFVSGTGEKSPLRRPVAVLSVVLVVLVLSTLTYMGETSPWSPQMTAWSATTVPMKYLKDRSPLQVHGALVLQHKQCRNCHALDGQGGQRGPALDTVATRLTHDELIRQVIQGGGNMPAYGKKLSPAEVEAVVSFMDTLRPDWVAEAHNSAESEGGKPLPKGFDRNTSQASPPDSGAVKAAVP